MPVERGGDRMPQATEIPSALDRFDDLLALIGTRRPAVFLDYDGTLTPIAARPDLAALDPAVRATVDRLASLCPVAVVSGRDLDDVARMVGIDRLVYAGSHGFDIRGPNLRRQIAAESGPALDRAAGALKARLGGIEGLLIERKRFAIAVHTRLVDPAEKARVADAVRDVGAASPDLRVTGGKEIHELRPDVPWDKGRAVLALLDALGLAGEGTPALYLGDDETDEDAFRALAQVGGVGVRVMDPPSPTAAAWSLPDPAAAGAFLARLADALERAGEEGIRPSLTRRRVRFPLEHPLGDTAMDVGPTVASAPPQPQASALDGVLNARAKADAAASAIAGGNLDPAVVLDLKSAEVAFAASAQVMKAADENTKRLLDMTA